MRELIEIKPSKILEVHEGDWFHPFTPIESLGFAEWEFDSNERLTSAYYGYARDVRLKTVTGSIAPYEIGLTRDEVNAKDINFGDFFFDDGSSVHFIPFQSTTPAQLEESCEARLVHFGITNPTREFGDCIYEKSIKLPSGMILTERSNLAFDEFEEDVDEDYIHYWQHPITKVRSLILVTIDSPTQFSKIALRIRRVDAK